MPCRGWAFPESRKKTIPYVDDLPYRDRDRRRSGQIRGVAVLANGEFGVKAESL